MGTLVGTGILTLTISQQMMAKTGLTIAELEQLVYSTGTASADLQQVVANVTGVASAELEQLVYSTGTVSVDVVQTVWQQAGAGYGEGYASAPVVTLKGVDVSARLTGRIRVEAEEGGARIAEITLEPAAGAIALSDWVGAAVTIDYAILDGAGAVSVQTRIFTGVVDVPAYDPLAKLTTFHCTDDLQGQLVRADRASIDTAVGGYYSSVIFDSEADNWTYTQDRLSTIPYAYDLEADGTARLTAWAAKATADITFTEGQIFDETLRVQLAERRDLHNVVNIGMQYRFPRLIERQVQCSWRYEGGFCAYLANGSALPTDSMVETAVSGAGWLLVASPGYLRLPVSQFVNCSGGVIGWVISESVRAQLAIGASFTLAKRWTQTITESYTVEVIAPESVAQLGELPKNETASLEASATDAAGAWESGNSYTDAPAGGLADANGDTYWDQTSGTDDGRSVSDAALETLIARARTGILDAHRGNIVTFAVRLHPGIERHQTLRVEHTNLTAQGKVHQIVHEMDLDTGADTTTVSLAVSKTQALGLSSDPVAAPAPPAATPTATRTSSDRVELGTYLGGYIGAAAYDENWSGWIDNHYAVAPGSVVYGSDAVAGNLVTEPGAPVYPTQFVIHTDAIEDGARNPATLTREQTVQVAIPDDTLTMAA